MTKEEFFKLVRQEKKDNNLVVTWISEEGKLTSHRIEEVKVNLTRHRIELAIFDC